MSAVSTAVPSFLPGLILSLQKNANSLNLSRSFHCSVVKVVLFVVLLSVLRDNFYILPQLSALVNSFFKIFYFYFLPPLFCFFRAVEFNNIMFFYICQHFFTNFFQLFWKLFPPPLLEQKNRKAAARFHACEPNNLPANANSFKKCSKAQLAGIFWNITTAFPIFFKLFFFFLFYIFYIFRLNRLIRLLWFYRRYGLLLENRFTFCTAFVAVYCILLYDCTAG